MSWSYVESSSQQELEVRGGSRQQDPSESGEHAAHLDRGRAEGESVYVCLRRRAEGCVCVCVCLCLCLTRFCIANRMSFNI